ncbi:hypothetical protein PGT21_011570 [Puccinia graminis f. sp. tritici]|uniref:Uncharacterized protein n=1 Tax=Puccinia graminis f. sp. tritici TaxID=56615 RepID=A0A5B0M9W6_PUCGR|nr:hypothetical protein PGT21_011570 [Puccinia graminis f. sp. tritici]
MSSSSPSASSSSFSASSSSSSSASKASFSPEFIADKRLHEISTKSFCIATIFSIKASSAHSRLAAF